MGKLGEMINNNQIELQQFFTMHPFSASEKRVYESALKGIDFFKELYVANSGLLRPVLRSKTAAMRS